MAVIIEFPHQPDPPPYRPNSATRAYLARHKCSAIISSRIPFEIKRFLMAEAYVSDARFSEHIARILTDHAQRQDLQRLKVAA